MELLFFTPHAALWPHTAPEAYLARALAEYGHRVSYLTCGQAQTYCAPMTARGLAPTCENTAAARICVDCLASARVIESVYRFPIDSLGTYLDSEDKQRLDAMAAGAAESRSLDTEYLGIKVGRIALYEFTLAHKKMSTELTLVQWEDYQVYLANALRTLDAFARYFQKQRPVTIFSFSPQYSNINSCMQYAINQGTRVLFIESGTNLAHRLGTMRVWDWRVHKLVNPALVYWDASENHPVTPEAAAKVTGHFRQLLTGYHFAVFSAPYVGADGIMQRWNVMSEQKILLMTLSSYDEAYAALLIDGFPYEKVFSDVFQTQAEWVRATIAWVRERPDLFLVIRVHPRDFPNKRETFRSEQSFMLEDLLENVPANVHVNWPAEGVSLYELLEDTDVLLTGWSVTALEALVLGIPVVTYDARLPSYPANIHYTGRSESEYYLNIERALADGWRLENSVNGFRWLAYNFVTCTVTVSEDFGQFELGRRSLLHRLWLRVKNRFPTLSRSLDLLVWNDALTGAGLVSEMIEHGYDALPPARAAIEGPVVRQDDRSTVVAALATLHQLLYAESKLPMDKSGLSRNIRTLISREEQQ